MKKQNGLAPDCQEQARETSCCRLEAELQTELHFASIQSACRLAPVCLLEGLVVCSSTGCCQQEVRAIKDVEGVRVKLQINSLCDLKDLGESHIGVPLTGSNERISAQITYAS